MMKNKEYKIDEGQEFVGMVDLFENTPWYIRFNPLIRLLGYTFVYRRYIDLMDKKGNVRRVYENEY